MADQLVAQRVRLVDAVARDHEDRDLLAAHRVGRADGRGLGDGGVRHERRLDLGRGDAVAGDVDDVVDAAHQPEVAVLVGLRAVAREVRRSARSARSTCRRSARRRPRGCAASTATAASARGSRRRRAAPRRPARRRSPPRCRAAAAWPSRASSSSAPGSGAIMIAPVSVCHQVSTIGQRPSPTCSWYQTQASGLIGSPTVPSRRSDDRSKFCTHSSPALIRARIAVGAV